MFCSIDNVLKTFFIKSGYLIHRVLNEHNIRAISMHLVNIPNFQATALIFLF